MQKLESRYNPARPSCFSPRLKKFLKGFFLLSERQKICFFNGGWDICLTKEQSTPVQTGEQVPLLTGYVEEKLYKDLVSMSETMSVNRYVFMAEDSFS